MEVYVYLYITARQHTSLGGVDVWNVTRVQQLPCTFEWCGDFVMRRSFPVFALSPFTAGANADADRARNSLLNNALLPQTFSLH